MKVRFIITPDQDTSVLIGRDVVWAQPAIGEPVILAARNDTERAAAASARKARHHTVTRRGDTFTVTSAEVSWRFS